MVRHPWLTEPCCLIILGCWYYFTSKFPDRSHSNIHVYSLAITATWEKKPIVVMVPGNLPGPAPVLVFMHGLTAEIGMMQENLMGYASHGFVTMFPYIDGVCMVHTQTKQSRCSLVFSSTQNNGHTNDWHNLADIKEHNTQMHMQALTKTKNRLLPTRTGNVSVKALNPSQSHGLSLMCPLFGPHAFIAHYNITQILL